MRPTDDLHIKIRNLNLKASDSLDNKIHARIEDSMAKHKNKSSANQPGRWRIIMNNKITKLAAAAVIVIAILIGIDPFGEVGVALADVAEKIEQTTNCVFKKTTTVYSEGNVTNEFDSLVYYTEAAVREDVYRNEALTNQVYVQFLEGIVVGVDHQNKLFKKMDLTDEDVDELSQITPSDFINLLLSKGKYEKLGRKKVDGVLSDGFGINDKRSFLSMDKDKIKDVNMRLWVDVETKLPIRIEVEATLINDAKATVIQWGPKWDIELEPDFFEPKIPVDYMKPEERGFIGINLENWPTLKPVPGMAAEKAGIEVGDVVLEVNGNIIADIETPADADKLLRGKIGEKTTLTVKRGEDTFTFEIERMPLLK